MRTPEELIKAIVAEQGEIKDVFLTACGGSLVDLYPGYYFINAESETMHSHWLTAKELVVSPSKFLKKGALVILCSHGGNTGETVAAAKYAKECGAAVITMTHNPESICAQEEMNPIVYSWEDSTNEKDRPQGIVMRILNELMKMQEPSYTKYEAILDGLEKADGIVRAAVKKVQNRTWVFAEKYFEEPFLYSILFTGIWILHLLSSGDAVDGLLLPAFRRIFPWTIRVYRRRSSVYPPDGNRSCKSNG